jgi:hypothetical protein
MGLSPIILIVPKAYLKPTVLSGDFRQSLTVMPEEL